VDKYNFLMYNSVQGRSLENSVEVSGFWSGMVLTADCSRPPNKGEESEGGCKWQLVQPG
jgi:hypothetical protein